MPRYSAKTDRGKFSLDLVLAQGARRELLCPALAIQFPPELHSDRLGATINSIHEHPDWAGGRDFAALHSFEPLRVVAFDDEATGGAQMARSTGRKLPAYGLLRVIDQTRRQKNDVERARPTTATAG